MKTLLTILLASLLISFTQKSTAQQNDFVIKTDKDTITIVSGKSATFKVGMTLPNGFDGWVNLHSVSVLNTQLSDSLVHSPYTGVTLTVGAYQKLDVGIYDINISGEYYPNSGNNIAVTHCYLNILPLPYNPDQWRIFYSGFMPSYILQDADKNYWYNQASIDMTGTDLFKQEEKTLIEKMKNSNNYFVKGGRMINPPTIDNKNGLIWMATRYFNGDLGGVVRYTLDGKNQTIFNYRNSPLPDSSANIIAIDTIGGAWIGTDKGLARLVGTEWTVFNSSNTNSILNKEPITSIAISGSIVWVGTTNGLVKYDGTEWTRFTPQNSAMPAPHVWKIAVETNGDLWMGLSTASYDDFNSIGQPSSMIGLAKFDGINWIFYNDQNSPFGKDNYINSITIDKKGNKWFSTAKGSASNGNYKVTNGAGILKFDNHNWIAYTTVNSPILSNKINWVGLDNNDNVWFSSFFNLERDCFWGVFNENGLPPLLAPTSVEAQPVQLDGITISPNPTSTTFTISGIDGVSSVKILNSLGMEVKQLSMVNGQLSIDVSDLASGVYFVQFCSQTGVVSKPIVVSR